MSISVLFSEIVTFWTKREIFNELSLNCFKTTGEHNSTVYGTFCREKQFLLILLPFYWFDQKQLFKQINILFKHAKKNKLSEYFSAPF